MRKLGLVTAALTILIAATPLTAQSAPLHSGLYESLQIAVRQDGHGVGRYFEERGTEPHFSCEFYFAGKAVGGRADGVSWAEDETHPARVETTSRGVELTAPKSSDYPGCGMTIGAMAEEGEDLSLTRKGAWTDLVVVHGARVHLRPGPAETPARAYVVDGDIVGVLQNRSGWLEIEYVVDEDHASHGWIKTTEAGPLAPPPAKRR